MSESWRDLSEIVLGLGLQGRISINTICPEKLQSPYDQAAKMLKENKELEDIIGTVGLSVVQPAMDAAKSLNGLEEKANWVSLLELAYSRHNIGSTLERFGKELQRGKEVDWSKIVDLGHQMVDKKTGMIPLSEIVPMEVPFIKCGWKSIDTHLGGIPEVGIVLVAGYPGVGKTSWAVKFASEYVKYYKKKYVGFFSLEMILGEIATRYLEIDPTLTNEHKDRILINQETLTVSEVVDQASLISNLGLIIIDFADLLIPGEVSEPEMAVVYKSLAAASKRLHVPVLLLAQLNRAYQGDDLPRPYNVRYTGLAESLSWMILMLHAPSRDYFKEEGKWGGQKKKTPELPVVPGKAYTICWKCRGGFRQHKMDGEYPGAIQSNWCGDKGWSGGAGKWFSLAKGRATDDDEDDDD